MPSTPCQFQLAAYYSDYSKFKLDIQEYLDELRGYTPNDYLYLTENVVTDEPLPVNVNFFLNKY